MDAREIELRQAAAAATTIADAIRIWRIRLALTQEDLAHELGVTMSTVNRWERGHATPNKLARKMMTTLGRQRGTVLIWPGTVGP